MQLIIDAQIIKAYYSETITETSHSLTDNPSGIIDKLSRTNVVNLDNERQIEQEWRDRVDSEWFDPWLAELFRLGKAREIKVDKCISLRDKLKRFGFPTHGIKGKDFWYIRTAASVINLIKSSKEDDNPIVFIVSEDLDFHDPEKKRTAKGQSRTKILISDSRPLKKFLLKNEGICIKCVQNIIKSI